MVTLPAASVVEVVCDAENVIVLPFAVMTPVGVAIILSELLAVTGSVAAVRAAGDERLLFAAEPDQFHPTANNRDTPHLPTVNYNWKGLRPKGHAASLQRVRATHHLISLQ
jgi:hypothetical protein